MIKTKTVLVAVCLLSLGGCIVYAIFVYYLAYESEIIKQRPPMAAVEPEVNIFRPDASKSDETSVITTKPEEKSNLENVAAVTSPRYEGLEKDIDLAQKPNTGGFLDQDISVSPSRNITGLQKEFKAKMKLVGEVNEYQSVVKLLSVDPIVTKFDYDSSFPTNLDFSQMPHTCSYLVSIGHADSKGFEKYNLALSINRAEQIKTALLKYIEEQEIVDCNVTYFDVIGKGELVPAPGRSYVPEMEVEENRRVELYILP